MIKKFLKERYYCGLDIGSQTIKASLIKSRDTSLPGLLGVYDSKTCGLAKSSVLDLGELSGSIHAALSGLSRKTGIKLKSVQLGIGGDFIEKRPTAAIIPLVDRGNKVIASRDVKRLLTQTRLLGANMDEFVLHDFPQIYIIDDVNIAINPLGLYGRKLEMRALLLVVNNTLLKNLVKAVNHAGYDVANLFFTSFAAATASVPAPHPERGCLFVDIGATHTDVLVFKDQQLKDFERIDWGGEIVTRAISQRLNLPDGLTEDIKNSYGFVLSSESHTEEEILIKQEEGYLPIRKAVISEAIEPVIQTFEATLRETWQKAHKTYQLAEGIILCGGGAQLTGLAERLEQQILVPVVLGKVNIAIRKLHNSSKYAAAVGLAQEGFRKSLGTSSLSNSSATGINQLVNKVKELYQEYF